MKSKFNISSQDQAKKIIDALQGWMAEGRFGRTFVTDPDLPSRIIAGAGRVDMSRLRMVTMAIPEAMSTMPARW